MSAASAFLEARDFLLAHRTDYDTAYAGFRWPALTAFNWALDYFDVMARGNARPALWIVDEQGDEARLTFDEMRLRSNRVANFLRAQGVRRGDRILMMLPNVVPLWEITLAAMKLGAVLSPATTLLAHADIEDRFERGGVTHVITDVAGTAKFANSPGHYTRIVVGGTVWEWTSYADADSASAEFVPDGETLATDPLLLYFTSGTTAKPKMVLHTHQSYPVGHLSTMYWLGVREGDIHFNISSPGWAKHAWSCVFAPWNAGATVFLYNQARFDPIKTLDVLVRCGVTTLCAPPTVWRLLILEPLASYKVALREVISAGEPLNPEVIEQVRSAWGLTIRDGYGQTETTCQVGNSPGQAVKFGSMGRAMPGYRIALVDHDQHIGDDGEISIALHPAPLGLMAGYLDTPERTAQLLGGTHYPTSDVAHRDADGYYWYIGRDDDVFKSSDYRISPFELESALIEHEAVAEAAVVPSPDAIRLAVPKAFIALKPGFAPGAVMAQAIFSFLHERLAPYARVRRIEFAELPKTISGKIRRVQLRAGEMARGNPTSPREGEYWDGPTAR
ncbi:MAG: AMP-binding protein [Gemmatimonadaceae bacterium]|nr:AMP-binding protein [Gemmatimonadaceae bacterium]